MITSKSENIKHVPDSFFEDIEEIVGNLHEKYGTIGMELLAAMKCKYCQGEIKCTSESWGSDMIAFSGLYCKKCNKAYGWTGFRMYKTDKTPVKWWIWLLSFLTSFE